MPFEKIQSEKLSASVARQIELLILRGVLLAGERLPAERDLAERLGVSRPSLREALQELTEAGLLTARLGAGIFVAEVLGSAFSPALIDLFARHEEAVFDYIAFRRDIEGLATERAATAASDTDLAVISAILAKMEAAHLLPPSPLESDLDAQFHMAIIEASHNVIMLHMMRSMLDLLKQGVFSNRQKMFTDPSIRDDILEQHRAITLALLQRDPQAARGALEAHLDFVAEAMMRQIRHEKHEAVARQRLSQEQAR